MESINLALITGVDIPISECRLTVHQPSIKEISVIGEREFFRGVQTICISKPMDRNDLANISNFQIFMKIVMDKAEKGRKQNVLDTLFILFPKYKVTILPRSLLFNIDNENIIIDENNFSSLQEVLRQISCLNGSKGDQFNPGNAAAAEIARKLERGRQRVAAQKQGAGNNASVFSQYLSILSVGLHMSLQDLSNLTVYQFYDLIDRYTLYINWDLDLRQRLAGGTPDSKPDNWMKIIH